MPSLEKFHLVGYSLGGRLALQYTHLFSRKVASLTLASSHAGLRTEEEKKERFLLDTMWAERLLSLPLEAFLSKWYTQPIFGGFQPDLSKRRLHDAKELAKTMLHYSLSKQPFLDPKNALVMVGEKDEKYRTLWPKAKIIPNAAHMIHLENPSLFAQFLLHQL
jgi:2-succinyl-6-hydroxy-2,4-cyclohexadiene-1-carboxylate synthase